MRKINLDQLPLAFLLNSKVDSLHGFLGYRSRRLELRSTWENERYGHPLYRVWQTCWHTCSSNQVQLRNFSLRRYTIRITCLPTRVRRPLGARLHYLKRMAWDIEAVQRLFVSADDLKTRLKFSWEFNVLISTDSWLLKMIFKIMLWFNQIQQIIHIISCQIYI